MPAFRMFTFSYQNFIFHIFHIKFFLFIWSVKLFDSVCLCIRDGLHEGTFSLDEEHVRCCWRLFLNPCFVYNVIIINSCNLLHSAQQERTYILVKPDPRTHVCRRLHIRSLPHEPAIHLFYYTGNPPWRPGLSSTWLADGPHVIWDPNRLLGAAVWAVRICIGLGFEQAQVLC